MSKSEEFIKNKIEDVLTFNSFDHKRQYPLNEQAQWLDDFAHEELLRYVYNETRIATLAHIYKQGIHEAAIVATICDQVIDRSGKLLGEVRKIIREEKK